MSCRVFFKRNFYVMQTMLERNFHVMQLCCSMSCKEFLKRNFDAKQSFRNEISMSCKVFLILNSESKAPDSNVWQNLQKRRDTTRNKLFQFIPATPSSRLKFHNISSVILDKNTHIISPSPFPQTWYMRLAT